jgi:ABC-2 type transport system ATP-binding protein
LILETFDLTKMYGDNAGCLDVCLSMDRGQVFGLLGPNGAGKSTLVKMLVSLLIPTSGSARIFDRPIGDVEVRRRIGYLPENFNYQPWLTGEELLGFHASLCGMTPAKTQKRVPEVLDQVGLVGKERQKVGAYSKGMRQRIGLACALLNDPDLVFLDEPTSALDPLGRRDVRQILLELRDRGKSVFLNSHLLSEVEMVCDHVDIIDRGKIVAGGKLEDLLARNVEVQMEIEGANQAMLDELARSSHGVNAGVDVSVGSKGNLVTLSLDSRDAIPALVEAVTRNGGRLFDLQTKHRSLEDLYVSLIKGEGGPP